MNPDDYQLDILDVEDRVVIVKITEDSPMDFLPLLSERLKAAGALLVVGMRDSTKLETLSIDEVRGIHRAMEQELTRRRLEESQVAQQQEKMLTDVMVRAASQQPLTLQQQARAGDALRALQQDLTADRSCACAQCEATNCRAHALQGCANHPHPAQWTATTN